MIDGFSKDYHQIIQASLLALDLSSKWNVGIVTETYDFSQTQSKFKNGSQGQKVRAFTPQMFRVTDVEKVYNGHGDEKSKECKRSDKSAGDGACR